MTNGHGTSDIPQREIGPRKTALLIKETGDRVWAKAVSGKRGRPSYLVSAFLSHVDPE